MTNDLHEEQLPFVETTTADGETPTTRIRGGNFLDAIDALMENDGSNLPPEQVGYVKFWANEISTLRADLERSAQYSLSERLTSTDVQVLNDFQLAVDFWNKPPTAMALDFLMKVCNFPEAITADHALASLNQIIAAHPFFPLLHPVLQNAVQEQVASVADPLHRVSCHI